ncbi:MAG: T9SS type A sorting domain-containing protein, partial [Candidatus Krumholzibacteria bacterium]|nr:T9SS type A sorting domain-containing protein [Candidatus Krumholzibacteria bacterium]
YGFTAGNREVSLVPVANLADGATYVIEVTDGLLDETMTPVLNPAVTNFTTAATVPLVLSSVNPPSATPHVIIVLAGTGFDPVLTNNTVLFNDIEVAPRDGSIDYLNVKVPSGVESGTIRVVAGPDTSNARSFTGLEPETSPVDEVITTVGTGFATQAIAVAPDGSMIYSLSPEADVVVPTDIVEFISYGGIAVGDHPISIKIHPAGERAYIANFGSGNVSVIDVDPDSPDYHDVISNLPVGANPIDLAVSPEGDRLYVANVGSGSISVIDADEQSETYNQVLATIGTGSTTSCVTIKPDGALIYVGTEDGYIIIDPLSYAVVARIGTGSATQSLTIKPDGALMFLLTTEGEVLIVDIEPGSDTENFVVARVSGGSSVKSITMKPDGLLLYLILEESDIIIVVLVEVIDAISVIDPDIVFPPKTVVVSIVDSLYAGEDPAFLVFDPTGTGIAYVTNTGPQTVTVINTSEIPAIMIIVSEPEDRTVYIWPIWQYVQLDGFTITNGSINASAMFDYVLFTEGPADFAEGDVSLYQGTTPLLAPGESHWVPGGELYVPGEEVTQMGGAEQSVYYVVSCHDFPAIADTSVMTLNMLPYTVAVLISDFKVVPLEGAVKIMWDISADEAIEGFNIYRTGGGEELLLNGSGLIAADAREFTDKNVEGGSEYVYTLGVVTYDGLEMKSMTESVEARAIPLALRQNYPNPFNPVTTISFTLPKRAYVNLAVYNVEGKLMRVLVDEKLDSGLKEIPWDGRDAKGIEASSGVYFYRLKADKKVLTKKMVLLR